MAMALAVDEARRRDAGGVRTQPAVACADKKNVGGGKDSYWVGRGGRGGALVTAAVYTQNDSVECCLP